MRLKDPLLPKARALWSRSKSERFFNAEVLPAVWPGSKLLGLMQTYSAYSPGEEYLASFEVKLESQPNEQPAVVSVTVAQRSRLRKMYEFARHGDMLPEADAAPGLIYGRKWFVEVFPIDHKLPFLRQAVDPGAMKSILADATGLDEETIKAVKAEVLSYKPHKRCVIAYEITTEGDSGPLGVIAKLYASTVDANQSWSNLNALEPQAAASTHNVNLPKPLAFQGENLVLMQRVRGEPIRRLLRGTEEDLMEAVHAAVDALIVLHNFHLDGVKAKATSDDLARARKRSALLQPVGPRFAQDVGALLDQIEGLSAALPGAGATTPIHGDFNPGQLFVDGERVWLLDLDSVRLGDPALDVGNFMADLRRTLISRPSLHHVPDRFLAEYVAKSGRKAVAARAHVQEAIGLLNTAIRRFEENPRRQLRQGKNSISAVLLNEVTACLVRSQMAARD